MRLKMNEKYKLGSEDFFEDTNKLFLKFDYEKA
jgi:hypothetical protein